MDQGVRLAMRALVVGLKNAGGISPHALSVIIDELRYAARDAREMLCDYEATQIELLAQDLAPGSDPRPSPRASVWL